jgi:hypothetical protein
MKKLFKGENNVHEKQTPVGRTLRIGQRTVVIEDTIAEGMFISLKNCFLIYLH